MHPVTPETDILLGSVRFAGRRTRKRSTNDLRGTMRENGIYIRENMTSIMTEMPQRIGPQETMTANTVVVVMMSIVVIEMIIIVLMMTIITVVLTIAGIHTVHGTESATKVTVVHVAAAHHGTVKNHITIAEIFTLTTATAVSIRIQPLNPETTVSGNTGIGTTAKNVETVREARKENGESGKRNIASTGRENVKGNEHELGSQKLTKIGTGITEQKMKLIG